TRSAQLGSGGHRSRFPRRPTPMIRALTLRRACWLALVPLLLLAWPMPASAATDVVRLTSVRSGQGETSVAVSLKKPSVMIVGYNDFRKINGSGGNMGYAYTTDGGANSADWHRDLYLKGITVSDPGSLGWDHASGPVVVYSAKDDAFKFATIGVIH